MITKIISGGQLGADMAGLDAALECGIPIGGTASAGYIQSTGQGRSIVNLDLRNKYGLKEGYPTTGSGQAYNNPYRQRTIANAQEADGTIWFGHTRSPGGKLTLSQDTQRGKPKPLINPLSNEELRFWIVMNNIQILNVAGNREWTNPGIYQRTKDMLVQVLKMLK